jgi:mannose/fructose/N-acetylgalactosamine-specific phosphotransferase system component IID
LAGKTTDAVSAAVPVIGGGVLFRMFLRSFFFQTLWNFKRMQNIGWLFTLAPALRRLAPDPEARRRLNLEHLEYFNTHPNLANLIVGVVARLEADHAAGENVRREQISTTKKFMSGPLAALGDTLFYAVARPFLGVFAIVAGWFFFRGVWWAFPLIFLVLYNVFHLSARWLGLWVGYRRKTDVVPALLRFNLQVFVNRAYWVGLILSSATLLGMYMAFGQGRAVAGILVGIGILAMRGGVSSTKVLYATVLASVAYIYFETLQ